MRRPTLADISPAHIRHGVKTGIAAVLALVLADVLHIEYGYWAVISAVIAMQMNVADAIEMCLYRFIGTVMGAVMGVVAIMVFPDTPVWNGVSVFVTTGLCAFLTRWDPRYRMAAITVSIVILASAGHAGRIDVGLFRVLEIAVGVGCAFVVTVTLWPVRAAVGLRRDLASQAENCAHYLVTLVDRFLARQTHVPADPDPRARRPAGPAGARHPAQPRATLQGAPPRIADLFLRQPAAGHPVHRGGAHHRPPAGDAAQPERLRRRRLRHPDGRRTARPGGNRGPHPAPHGGHDHRRHRGAVRQRRAGMAGRPGRTAAPPRQGTHHWARPSPGPTPACAPCARPGPPSASTLPCSPSSTPSTTRCANWPKT